MSKKSYQLFGQPKESENAKGKDPQEFLKYIPTFAIHFLIKILSNEKTTFFCPTHIELGNKVII